MINKYAILYTTISKREKISAHVVSGYDQDANMRMFVVTQKHNQYVLQPL